MLAASLEVRVAIFYATLINIVAVLPVMLAGGLTGAFFEPLALAYGLAVLASMLVALTVTPALGLILLGRSRLAPGDPPPMRVLKRGYAWALKWTLRSPVWAFAVVPVAIAAAVVVYPRIGQDLFPDFKEPDFLVHFVTKPDTSLPDMDRQVTQLQHELLAIPGVADVGSHIGTAPLGEEINGVNFSESWLSLSPSADSHFRHLERVEGVPFGPRLVIRGASERLSPILMTALATALALVPLVLYGNRPGQEIEYPMAIVILGGLATSTLLNLFVLPALYLSVGAHGSPDPAASRSPSMSR